MKRIFIAINLPVEIKNQLIALQKKWPTLPARWTKKENLHLTLLFLGYLDENQLSETIKKTEEIGVSHQPFLLVFRKVIYGPQDKKAARIVWLELEKNPELLALQKDLEENLFSLPSFKYKRAEKREYSPHITLARLKQWEFRRLEPEQRPEIGEELSLSFSVNSIEIMESKLKRSGAEYSILKSFPLEG